MEVGVRELKEHLSRWLDEAEAGTEIVVTDRGRPKVRIVPVREAGGLQRGIEEGWIRPPQRAGTIGGASRVRSTRRVLDVLDEDRG